MGKGFIQKHTAAELKRKADSHRDIAGGKEGKDRRTPKTALVCKLCKANIHNINIMKAHYEAKHPKDTLNPAEYEQ